MRVLPFLVLSMVLVTSMAWAQQPDARTLSEQAKAAFDAGDFGGAARLLEQAYALKPWPVLLYNLGRAYQQAGVKDRAVDAYERYLKEDPTSSDAGAVRESIRQLQDQMAHDQQLEAQARAERERSAREAADADRARAAAREANERARHKATAWPWVVMGTGIAGAGAGIVMGSLALSSQSSAVSDPSVTQAQSDHGTAEDFALVANVLFIAGGAVALVGLVWGIFDVRASTTVVHLRAEISPTSFGIAGTF